MICLFLTLLLPPGATESCSSYSSTSPIHAVAFAFGNNTNRFVPWQLWQNSRTELLMTTVLFSEAPALWRGIPPLHFALRFLLFPSLTFVSLFLFSFCIKRPAAHPLRGQKSSKQPDIVKLDVFVNLGFVNSSNLSVLLWVTLTTSQLEAVISSLDRDFQSNCPGNPQQPCSMSVIASAGTPSRIRVSRASSQGPALSPPHNCGCAILRRLNTQQKYRMGRHFERKNTAAIV